MQPKSVPEGTDPKLNEIIDRLESILAQKEAELRILRSELALRDLYQQQLRNELESKVRHASASGDCFDQPQSS